VAQVALSPSGPAQIVNTISVVANAAMAAAANRPKRMPSLLRAFRVIVSLIRLVTRAMGVLG